jgi:hypothetical protein
VTKVARQFGVTGARLRYRLDGRGGLKSYHAANSKLTSSEERALCRYIDRLDSINLAVRVEFVTDAANHILRARASPAELASPAGPTTVGQKWTTRFLKRHDYTRRLQKKLDSDREVSEDPIRVAQYFQALRKVLTEEGVAPESIWNMDETGFRIGVGKDQLIVTKRKRAHYFGIPENRESATSIEAISASGEVLPAFLILAGLMHMGHWYGSPRQKFCPSASDLIPPYLYTILVFFY